MASHFHFTTTNSMIKNFKENAKQIRLMSETLPEGNLIVSLDTEETIAGRFFATNNVDAARGIVNGTHRLASHEEEIDYTKNEVKNSARIIKEEQARRANFNINVQHKAEDTSELVAQVAALTELVTKLMANKEVPAVTKVAGKK